MWASRRQQEATSSDQEVGFHHMGQLLMTGAMWFDLISMEQYASKWVLYPWSGFKIPSRRWRPWLLPSPFSASWRWNNLNRLCGRFLEICQQTSWVPSTFGEWRGWMKWKEWSESNERRHFEWAQLRCHNTQVAWRWSPLLPKRRSPFQPISQKRADVDEMRWLFLECFWWFQPRFCRL